MLGNVDIEGSETNVACTLRPRRCQTQRTWTEPWETAARALDLGHRRRTDLALRLSEHLIAVGWWHSSDSIRRGDGESAKLASPSGFIPSAPGSEFRDRRAGSHQRSVCGTKATRTTRAAHDASVLEISDLKSQFQLLVCNRPSTDALHALLDAPACPSQLSHPVPSSPTRTTPGRVHRHSVQERLPLVFPP